VLRTEETRRIRTVRLVEIAGPEIIGLHHVEIAVEDQITLISATLPSTILRPKSAPAYRG
jgi:hypothetical protein